MINEVWRKVPQYEGLYEVSNLGRVRNAQARKGTRLGKVLKNYIGKKGYPVITLVGHGKRRLRKVHQIVAEVFIGPCPEGKMVNHRDGIKGNVRESNLEYVTDPENREHAKATGLMASGNRHGSRTMPESRTIGERNPMARLTEQDVRTIKRRMNEGVTHLAHEYEVSRSTIGDIKAGRTWAHLS